MPSPKLKKSDAIHKGYCSLFIDHMELENGEIYPYTRLEFGFDATAIIAETPDGKLVLNKEFRLPPNTWLLSASGGKIDSGEEPKKAALRELTEETGYTSSHLIHLGTVYPFPAMSKQRIHFFWAKEATFLRPPLHEPLEQIETILLTDEEIKAHIRSGIPVDGILLTNLYLKSLHT